MSQGNIHKVRKIELGSWGKKWFAREYVLYGRLPRAHFRRMRSVLQQ